MTTTKTKILIAADPGYATDNMVSWIENDESFQMRGPVNTTRELVQALAQETPDILVMEINMPLIDAIDTLSSVAANHPTVKTVVMSEYNSPRLIPELKKMGARAYLLRSIPYSDFKLLVTEVVGGLKWTQYLVDEATSPQLYYISDEFSAYQLTNREVEVLQLMYKHFTMEEIGDFLFLSQLAIEIIKENLCTKLGIQNENQLLSFAKENKIVE